MTVSELIRKLQDMPLDCEVNVAVGNNLVEVLTVDSGISRDPYDGDWDTSIVILTIGQE